VIETFHAEYRASATWRANPPFGWLEAASLQLVVVDLEEPSHTVSKERVVECRTDLKRSRSSCDLMATYVNSYRIHLNGESYSETKVYHHRYSP